MFRIPAGSRVYAVGDIHGCRDLLAELLAKIEADIQTAPDAHHQVVFLGDYIDRGPDTAGVIATLLAFAQTTPTVFLKGNHEGLVQDFIDDPTALAPWATVGGLQTLMSYGLTPPSRPTRTEMRAEHAAFLAALPTDHFRFLEALRLFHVVGDFFFVHAGVRPRRPLDDQVEPDLLWIRDEFLQCAHLFEKRIVHGHTPVHAPDVRPNRINVDTGAFATGRLTAAVLEDDSLRFLQTGEGR